MQALKFSALLVIAFFIGFGDGAANRHEPDFKPLDSFALLLKGFDATDAQDHDRAIGLYTQVIEFAALPSRNISTAYRARGDAYFRKGFSDKALQDYASALRLNPHNVSAYINRSNVWTVQEKYGEALVDLGKAIKLDPHDGFAFQVRGNVHFYMGYFGKAMTDYRRSLGLEPSDLFSAIWLYLAQARAGKDGRKDLISKSKNMNSEVWPAPVVSLFVGDITPVELMDIAKVQGSSDKSDLVSEAYFYSAEYYLLRGEQRKAAEMFRRIVAEGTSALMEYTAAKIELKRLNH